jgi:uncharacterized protein (TIGR00266 family)
MSDSVWYVGIQGQQQGPLTTHQIIEQIRTGQISQTAYVYSAELASWTPISAITDFAAALHDTGGAAPGAPPPPPPPSGAAPGLADQIDYEIFGEEMQFVEVVLDPNEAAVAEAGAFFYMEPGIEMQTIFGDGSTQHQQSGFFAKLLSAGKRLVTGESLFMTVFGNADQQRRKVAFAAPYPGKIVPVDLREHDGVLLCQKDAFLCAAKGIAVGVEFQKKLGAGLFGGEGFLLQKLEGQGLAFIHAGGTIVSRQLAEGETLRLDTGCLVAFERQVSYDIKWIGGVKSALFGGEGLFFASLTGPGRIWMQSLPLSRLAGRIFTALYSQKGEGSIIGGLGMGD